MKIMVKVKPGALKEEVIRIADSEYLIFLRERAEDGKANMRLRKVLAREFSVGAKQIIIKNPNSRMKIIEIEGK